jgi:hypothetical protein
MSAVDIDLDDLFSLDGAPLTRKHVHIISGKKFTLHELSASALWSHSIEMGKLRSDLTDESSIEQTVDLNRLYTKMVARFLRGEDYQPTDQDVEALTKKLSSDQIDALYTAGMTFNGSSETAADAIAKN